MDTEENQLFTIDLEKAVICEDENLRKFLVYYLEDLLDDYFTKKHNAKKFHFNNDELKAITKIHKYTLPKSYYYLKTKERNRYDAMYDIPLHLFIERFENADFRDIRNKRNEIPHFVYGIIYYFYNDVCSEGNNMRKKWYTEVATTLNVDKDKIRTKGHNFYKELYQNLKNK